MINLTYLLLPTLPNPTPCTFSLLLLPANRHPLPLTTPGKKDHLKLEMGPGTMTVMNKIKKAMDEENLLNPEKVV